MTTSLTHQAASISIGSCYSYKNSQWIWGIKSEENNFCAHLTPSVYENTTHKKFLNSVTIQLNKIIGYGTQLITKQHCQSIASMAY
jgi:hypothetical protein